MDELSLRKTGCKYLKSGPDCLQQMENNELEHTREGNPRIFCWLQERKTRHRGLAQEHNENFRNKSEEDIEPQVSGAAVLEAVGREKSGN